MLHKLVVKSALILTLCAMAWLSACVPAKQFDALKAKEKDCQDENAKLKSDNQDLNTKNTELLAKIEKMTREVSELTADVAKQKEDKSRLVSLYDELTKSYDRIVANEEKMMAGNTADMKKLLAQLNDVRGELQRKEDELKKQQAMLTDRENNLNVLKTDLKDREAKVAELQRILSRKDSVVKALKDAVNNALVGFVNNGLSVEQKNGKVYVSMEERLLFASGSTDVDKRGVEALKQLAQVLESRKDISIMVEGHTDDVPISGTLPSGAKDNWDLSVLRATSVVKIITKNSTVESSRITAAGRGPFFSLDASKTTEARKKNRRTEIILSPKLDELLKVLESN